MSTVISTTTYRALLAERVRDTSKITLYGLNYPTDWHLLYLVRMNIITLERNNDLQVLTAAEVQGMSAFINKNL